MNCEGISAVHCTRGPEQQTETLQLLCVNVVRVCGLGILMRTLTVKCCDVGTLCP